MESSKNEPAENSIFDYSEFWGDIHTPVTVAGSLRLLHDGEDSQFLSGQLDTDSQQPRRKCSLEHSSSGSMALFGVIEKDLVEIDIQSLEDIDGYNDVNTRKHDTVDSVNVVPKWCRWVIIGTGIMAYVAFVAMMLLPMGEGQGPWPFGVNLACPTSDGPRHYHSRQYSARALSVFTGIALVSSTWLTFLSILEDVRTTKAFKVVNGLCGLSSIVYIACLPFECAQSSSTALASFICSSFIVVHCFLAQCIHTLAPRLVTVNDRDDEADRMLLLLSE